MGRVHQHACLSWLGGPHPPKLHPIIPWRSLIVNNGLASSPTNYANDLQLHTVLTRHDAPPSPQPPPIMPDFKSGQTVQLSDGRKGIVRFAGQTHFQVGEWVGVELEDKTGKNDGSVQGERYFDCPMGYGMFVKPMMVTILAQPPAAKPAAARKPARPSSLNPVSGRTSAAGGDVALTKRRSMNAPSPSPGPKMSRPTSAIRVSVPTMAASMILTRNQVPCKVSHQATERPAQLFSVTDRHALEHARFVRRK